MDVRSPLRVEAFVASAKGSIPLNKTYIKYLLIAVFHLSCLCLQAQVVINEVVTDPQQDWSSNGFDGTIGAGAIDSDDDWVELLITANGLDLTTGWTIELNDASPESGSLNAGGAFQIVNYISTTGGTMNDTDAGDYLVLGTMTTGAINQIVTVVITDGVTTIDQV